MLFHLWGHLICNAYTTPDRPQLLPSASMSLKKSLLPCISHVSRLVVSDSLRPHEIKRRLLPGRKVMTHLDSILKSRDHFVDKGPSSQGYGFSSGRVWMWELDHKESWALKNSCLWTGVFIGRTDVEAEMPILWPPDAKSWLTEKDPDAGKDWGREEKGTTEDKMVEWHHWLNGYGFGWTPGVGDRQGGLACSGSWGRRVGHDWLNWTELKWNAFLSLCVYLSFIYLTPNLSTFLFTFNWISSLGNSIFKNKKWEDSWYWPSSY